MTSGTRLAWMDFYRRSSNVARTCRHFGISRQTFYCWQRRYDPQNLATREERSHRPHRRRQATWSASPPIASSPYGFAIRAGARTSWPSCSARTS